MRPYNHHKLLLSLEVVTLLLLLCLKFMKTSKNPYKYETAIMIIILGSMVLSPVSFMPDFTYVGGLSPAFLFQSDDNISFFVSLINIPVRFDDLFQRINPVYDRFELARLDQFFEQEQVFELIAAV
jgi:hypothetical protein